MVKLQLKDVGKRYLRNWIVRNLSTELSSDHAYLLSGHNGSGKSTVLQMLSGFITPTEGEIKLEVDEKVIEPEHWYRHLSLCGPYLEIHDSFTLTETLHFHQKLKPLQKEYSADAFAQEVELDHQKNKAIKHYSSGMQQRVKLGLTLLSGCPIILLDEPLSNLDEHGISWYKRKMSELNTPEKLIMVCSNRIAEESFFCDEEINVEDHKPAPRKT